MNLPAVILVRPREEGNVGAVARAMANMGLDRLIVAEPATALGSIARGFGIGGWEILDNVTRADSFAAAIEPFGRVVGTTSRRRRPLRRHRIVAPRGLPEVLAADPPGSRTALVFGPEDSGLRRDELECCSPVVEIPCARDHPTLNLAQAVLILTYELRVSVTGHGVAAPSSAGVAAPSSAGVAASSPAVETLASAGEIEALRPQVEELLLAIGYDDDPIRAGLLRDLFRLLVRASPDGREVGILRRLCNRATSAWRRRTEAQPR